MSTGKSSCRAALIVSLLAIAPLSSVQAAPWRIDGKLPSVEKADLLSWVRALEGLWLRITGDEGCSIDPNGVCIQGDGGPRSPGTTAENPDGGMSIDPNGGQ